MQRVKYLNGPYISRDFMCAVIVYFVLVLRYARWQPAPEEGTGERLRPRYELTLQPCFPRRFDVTQCLSNIIAHFMLVLFEAIQKMAITPDDNVGYPWQNAVSNAFLGS
jgi:hypothetical protein